MRVCFDRRARLAGAVALSILAVPASGGVLRVPGDYATIQAALDASVDGDVVLVDDGVYRGPGNTNVDFGGRAVTLRSENGPKSCVVDGEGVARAFTFLSGETPSCVLEGFTVRHGAAVSGGAMLCDGASSPTIRNCRFEANQAQEWGGAISCGVGCDPVIADCVFEDNEALLGGALAGSFSDLILDGCTFIGNAARQHSGFESAGGAVMLGRCVPKISRCVFRGNLAEGAGGGVHCHKSPITLESCLFWGNAAWWGAGYYGDVYSKPRIFLCTFVANKAAFDGGAIYGLHYGGLVGNCILRSNRALSGTGDQMFGNALMVYSNVEGGGPGIEIVDADPLFADAAAGDFRLSAGSPCIDAGHNWADAGLSPVDLGGNPRFADDAATPDTGCGLPVVADMGAYERPGNPAQVMLGDIDADGVVGVRDFLLLLAGWGSCPGSCCPADLNPDGEVAVSDLMVLLANWE